MRMSLRRGVQFLLPLTLLFATALPADAHGTQPITLPIDTPAQAHAAVLATGAPFDGFVLLDGALIGASQYYEVKGEPGSSASWIVVYTYGWGDCQAGCISRHSFTYQVDPFTGAVSFEGGEGEQLPSTAPESLVVLSGSASGPISSSVPAPRPGPWPVDGGDTDGGVGLIHELPKIILAVLLAWVGGAALVGLKKSRER